ncbi:TetR/AcrR family transcriptional regulator [Pseudomonas sp. Z18(2022)]|uniref:TetR/AcrR family transcriptional regulator n=1 Tax=Pseudomonas sp. Z18(2022) TaxID=2983410 RepID=UPI002E803816|nr:TetR/AcrR family transcriptional regulator [Pseudomonas sp. Z18(2022)]
MTFLQIDLEEIFLTLQKNLDRSEPDLYQLLAQARLGGEVLGRRERHKLDKLERISNATHLLFSREGYERTTLREIAKEADVALGTLSLYARDKRDLVLLIFNRVIPPLIEQGRTNSRRPRTLTNKMVAFFEPFYQAYAKETPLYRIVLGQLLSGTESVHARENDAIRTEMIAYLAKMIGGLAPDSSNELSGHLTLQARSFYYLYFASVRVWLSQDNPVPDQGLRDLRDLFALHISGIPNAS